MFGFRFKTLGYPKSSARFCGIESGKDSEKESMLWLKNEASTQISRSLSCFHAVNYNRTKRLMGMSSRTDCDMDEREPTYSSVKAPCLNTPMMKHSFCTSAPHRQPTFVTIQAFPFLQSDGPPAIMLFLTCRSRLVGPPIPSMDQFGWLHSWPIATTGLGALILMLWWFRLLLCISAGDGAHGGTSFSGAFHRNISALVAVHRFPVGRFSYKSTSRNIILLFTFLISDSHFVTFHLLSSYTINHANHRYFDLSRSRSVLRLGTRSRHWCACYWRQHNCWTTFYR